MIPHTFQIHIAILFEVQKPPWVSLFINNKQQNILESFSILYQYRLIFFWHRLSSSAAPHSCIKKLFVLCLKPWREIWAYTVLTLKSTNSQIREKLLLTYLCTLHTFNKWGPLSVDLFNRLCLFACQKCCPIVKK